jgi:hypothetical protein
MNVDLNVSCSWYSSGSRVGRLQGVAIGSGAAGVL